MVVREGGKFLYVILKLQFLKINLSLRSTIDTYTFLIFHLQFKHWDARFTYPAYPGYCVTTRARRNHVIGSIIYYVRLHFNEHRRVSRLRFQLALIRW